MIKGTEPVTEETLEIEVAKLKERDNSQWRVLGEIKDSIRRIEEKLDTRLAVPFPCNENNRRLNNLEKAVVDDHEPRIKTVEKFKDNLLGKMAAWGLVVILISNVVTGLILSYLVGLIGK